MVTENNVEALKLPGFSAVSLGAAGKLLQLSKKQAQKKKASAAVQEFGKPNALIGPEGICQANKN